MPTSRRRTPPSFAPAMKASSRSPRRSSTPNDVLRRKFTRDGRSGHGHSGVYALYADAASHLANLGAVAISADYVTLLRDAYAIDPIAHSQGKNSSHCCCPSLDVRSLDSSNGHTSRAAPRAPDRHGGLECACLCSACVCDVGTAQRQRRSPTTNLKK